MKRTYPTLFASVIIASLASSIPIFAQVAHRVIPKASQHTQKTESSTEQDILSQLSLARMAVKEHRYEQADAALQNAEREVRFSFGPDKAFMDAYNHAAQALNDYTSRNLNATKEALSKAEESLKTALHNGNEKTQEAGQGIMTDLGLMKDKVGQSTDDASKQLAGIGQRITILTLYNRKIAALDFQRVQEKNAKSYLLKAQMDLSLADSYQFKSNNKIKADELLASSSKALQEASLETASLDKAKVKAIIEHINFIKNTTDNRTQYTSKDYDDLIDETGELNDRLL